MSYDIAITGATGFIGAHYTRHFSERGLKVLALGRSKNAPDELLKYASYQSCDFGNKIKPIVANVCIHCAGLASEQASWKELLQANVEGTKNIFDAISAEHFVHISSASVYPPNELLHVETEEPDTTAISLYGQSKLVAEQWLLTQRGKKKITIIRPRAVYGLGDRILMPRLLKLRKGPFIIHPGDLNKNISLTHIKNLIHATDRLVHSDFTYDLEIFNVADTRSYILQEVIAEVLETVYQRKFKPLKIAPSIAIAAAKLTGNKDVNKEVLRYFLADHQVSSEKIRREIGVEFQFSLPDYLSSLQDWISSKGRQALFVDVDQLPWKV